MAEKSLTKIREQTNKHLKMKALSEIMMCFTSIGDLDRSYDFANDGELLIAGMNDHELEDSIYERSEFYNFLGIFYVEKRNLDQATISYQQSLALNQKLRNQVNIAKCYSNLGEIDYFKGNFIEALDYFNEALAIFGALDVKLGRAAVSINIGSVLLNQGEINLALNNYVNALEIYEQGENNYVTAIIYNNIGEIHHIKGDLEEAQRHLAMALRLKKKVGSANEISATLLELVKVAMSANDLAVALDYVNLLEKMSQENNEAIIVLRAKLAKALVLKAEMRTRKRGNAEAILEKIITDESIDYEITILAMLNLCELLLIDLKIINSQEIVNEIDELLDNLITIAKKNYSHWILAESYWLKSKILLLNLDFIESQNFFIKAHLITEEKNLTRLNKIISKEKEKLSEEYDHWKHDLNRTQSLTERLNRSGFEDLLSLVRQKKLVILSDLISDPQNALSKLKIAITFGSFTDSGWKINYMTQEMPFKKAEIYFTLEYSAILYQNDNFETIYGPFPQKQEKNSMLPEWVFLCFGFKIKDENIQDPRLVRQKKRTPSLILIFYPLSFDPIIILNKYKIHQVLISFIDENESLSSLNANRFTQLQEKLIKSIQTMN